MNLARSTYYYQKRRALLAAEKDRGDADLKDKIDEIQVEFPYYGYRMLHHELERRGHLVNRNEFDACSGSSVFSLKLASSFARLIRITGTVFTRTF